MNSHSVATLHFTVEFTQLRLMTLELEYCSRRRRDGLVIPVGNEELTPETTNLETSRELRR